MNTMDDELYIKIYELLEQQQLSISALSRELKTYGFEEHRLILTGYLRALRDLKKLNEINIPPSKVYSRSQQLQDGPEDLYSVLKRHIRPIELNYRFPLAVQLAHELFGRPVFKEELKLMGINQSNIKNFGKYPKSSSFVIKECPEKDIKELRFSITRIHIPPLDPAYVIQDNKGEINDLVNETLVEIIKDIFDISGLVPRTRQMKLISDS